MIYLLMFYIYHIVLEYDRLANHASEEDIRTKRNLWLLGL